MNSKPPRAAFRAQWAVSLTDEGPARSPAALDAPAARLGDAVLVTRGGLIESLTTYASFRRSRERDVPLTDLGPVLMAPGLINAHCHLELSHLAGKTRQGEGFAAWMRSLVPLADAPVQAEVLSRAINRAVERMRRGGAAHVGDVSGRNPALVAEAARAGFPAGEEGSFGSGADSPDPAGAFDRAVDGASRHALSACGDDKASLSGRAAAIAEAAPDHDPSLAAPGSKDAFAVGRAAALSFPGPLPESALFPGLLGVTHFLEAFGFGRRAAERGGPSPETAAFAEAQALAASLPPEARGRCAVSGHALYSTAPQSLRAALDWCARNAAPFAMHLAESPEEDECLRQGRGGLHDMLRERVLPRNWTPPGLGPVEYADRLGLLRPFSLLVHCVRCSEGDAALLAARGCSVCLCPRSNDFIGVGRAPARVLAGAGAPLCLGTDSLASNTDLDLRKELAAARQAWGFSGRAVLRMATVNAAHALRLAGRGSLNPGGSAAFSIFPPDWD